MTGVATQLKSTQQMVIIGISGGTGSGKTTLARKLLEILGEDQVLILGQDSYYQDNIHLPFEERAQLNFDHPNAVDFELLMEHLQRLKMGQPIQQPIYDFSRHLRQRETRELWPRPIVIVEGILLFENERLRQCLDLKVFVEVEADVRFIRRLHRDVMKRGRSLESVIQQYLQTVRPMHLQFVEPSKRYADIIVSEGGLNTAGIDLLIQRIKVSLKEPQG